MFGDGMDLEMSSGSQTKKRDPFQKELQRKLKDRRSRGLSADITSPEEESDDLSADDDFLSQFTTPKKRDDRPRSAKRRNQPSFLKSQRGSDSTPGLGDTLRPGAARDILGRTALDDYDIDDDDDDDSEMTLTFGPSKKSPRGLDSSGKQRPSQGEKLTKEDIIFGRKGSSPRDSKLPHQDSKEGKGMWQPPSFKKTQQSDADFSNRSVSPASSKGRRTPSLEPMLEAINETPTPRARRLSQASEKNKSHDEDSPRPKPRPRGKTEDRDTSFERKTPVASERKSPISELFGKGSKSSDSVSGRKTPPTDIFGKSGRPSALDFLEEDSVEETKAPTVTPRRRAGKPEVKSRTKSPGPEPKSRTKSPGPGGRKTPVKEKDEKMSKYGSSSPTDSKKADDIGSRRASVLDFLTGDSEPKKKPRKSSLQRANSRESVTEELENSETGTKKKDSSKRGRPQSRGTPKLERDPSSSSICDEVLAEPSQDEPESETRQHMVLKGSGKQRSDKQQADDAINFVASVQDDKAMQFIEPDKETKEDDKKKEPKQPKHRPKPRYPSKPGDQTPTSTASFDDTVSIRNAIYTEWYKERTRKAKEEVKEKKKQEAAEEEKKRKEKEDKILENKASYNAWMEKKIPIGKDKVRQKKEEEKRKEQELNEKEKKKKDAEKTFKMWKEKKDSSITNKIHKDRREELSKTREVHENKQQKQKQNETAYKSWKQRKDTVIQSKMKDEKSKVKEETAKEREDRKRKERAAVRQYEEWMQKKEEQEREQKRRERQRKLEGEEEFRPAWSPANKTIPFGR